MLMFVESSLTGSKTFGVVQTIVACVGVSQGLGRSSKLLLGSQIQTINDVRTNTLASDRP